mgnify:CR=1 FL=1
MCGKDFRCCERDVQDTCSVGCALDKWDDAVACAADRRQAVNKKAPTFDEFVSKLTPDLAKEAREGFADLIEENEELKIVPGCSDDVVPPTSGTL